LWVIDAVHVSSNRVYTIGYGGKKPVAFFEELSSLNYDIVVDVREDPDHAYLGCYTRKHLEKQLKEHYIWISELGNRTRTLPPTLVDEKIGMEKLHKLLSEHMVVVLLCAEKNEENCHRGYIRRRLQEETFE
jgi:uncharacterized protein (DUF488 family)